MNAAAVRWCGRASKWVATGWGVVCSNPIPGGGASPEAALWGGGVARGALLHTVSRRV